MNIFNRLLVIVITLAVLGAATLLILLTANLVMPEQLTTWSWLLARIQAIDAFAARHQVTTILVSLTVLLLGMTLLYYELRLASRPQLVLRQDDLGRMTVSLAGVGELANHAAKQVTGVLEASTRVKAKAKGLRILSRVSVDRSARLADISKQLQERIRTTLEEHLGYPVTNVSVMAQLSPLNRRSPARRLR